MEFLPVKYIIISMIILYLTKQNRNSIYSLLGILETYNYFINKDIIIFEKLNNLSLKNNEKHFFLFSFSTQNANDNFLILQKLKDVYKRSIFVCGGPHPSAKPQECLINGFDIVVKGGAENIIDEIFKINEFPKIIEAKNKVNLDNFPPYPLKDPHYSLYLEITRGCPFNCYFCQTTKIFGAKPVHRSIENILKYCEILIKNNLNDLRFVTPNAFSYGSEDGIKLNFNKLENLLSSLYKLTHKKGRIFFGSFPSEVRPEFVNDDAFGLIKKYCSNKKIIIGAQSGSDIILEKLHRKHTVKEVLNAVEIAKKHQIKVDVDIISGFPFETKKDVLNTIKFCEYLIGSGCRIHFHKFTPLPGTQFENLKSTPYFQEMKNFINKWMGKGLVYGKL